MVAVGSRCGVAITRHILDAVKDAAAFWIDILWEEGSVHTGIGGHFSLIELLDELQRKVGPIAELAVAFHLERGEVEEPWWGFCAVFLLYVSDGEWVSFYGAECGLGLLAVGISAFHRRLLCICITLAAVSFSFVSPFCLRVFICHLCGEGHIAVDGGEHPKGFGLEVIDFVVTFDDERQCGSLYTSDTQGLRAPGTAVVLSVFKGVKACGVHAQKPVADAPAQCSFIERLIVILRTEVCKPFDICFVCHGTYPQSFHRAGRLCLLHYPSLYEFTFLSGITAVDDHIGFLHQPFDVFELSACLLLEVYLKTLWNHRQCGKCPRFPLWCVLFRVLQFAQVSVGPCHLVPVAFEVTVVVLVAVGGGFQQACDVLGN